CELLGALPGLPAVARVMCGGPVERVVRRGVQRPVAAVDRRVVHRPAGKERPIDLPGLPVVASDEEETLARADREQDSHWADGNLISDYPLTRAVIETREPRTVYAPDAEADPAETKLLRELGFDSLLMLAIEAESTAWGLVEVYGNGRRFEAPDVQVAQALL